MKNIAFVFVDKHLHEQKIHFQFWVHNWQWSGNHPKI